MTSGSEAQDRRRRRRPSEARQRTNWSAKSRDDDGGGDGGDYRGRTRTTGVATRKPEAVGQKTNCTTYKVVGAVAGGRRRTGAPTWKTASRKMGGSAEAEEDEGRR